MSNCSNIRAQATKIASCVITNLYNTGTLFYANHNVSLVTEVSAQANETFGYIGQVQAVKTPIIPPPKVDIRDQFRNINNVITKVGDAKFDLIPQNLYTKNELEAATYWDIDGEQFNLVPGTVRDDPTSVFWSGVLAKVRTNHLPDII